jgi:hypothetical protein
VRRGGQHPEVGARCGELGVGEVPPHRQEIMHPREILGLRRLLQRDRPLTIKLCRDIRSQTRANRPGFGRGRDRARSAAR